MLASTYMMKGHFLGYKFKKTESFLSGDGQSRWMVYDRRTNEYMGDLVKFNLFGEPLYISFTPAENKVLSDMASKPSMLRRFATMF